MMPMIQPASLRNAALASVLACVLVGPMANPVKADVYQDILDAIYHADRAFKENRPGDAVKHLRKALDLGEPLEKVTTFQARDFLREAYHWANRRPGPPSRPSSEPPDADKAIAAADKAIRIDPQAPEAAEGYFIMGYVYGRVKQQNVDNVLASIGFLRTSLKLRKKDAQPVDAYWHETASSILFNSLFNIPNLPNRKELAVSVYRDLAKADPRNGAFHHALGLAHSQQQNLPLAAETFLTAIKCRIDNWQYHASYISVCIKEPGGTKAAIETYNELLKEHREELAVQMGLAKLYVEDDQIELALPLLKKIERAAQIPLDDDVKNYFIHNIRIELAEAFAKAKEYRLASTQLLRALAALPSNWTIGGEANLRFDLGRYLVKDSKLKEGIQSLKDALELNGKDPDSSQQQRLNILFELGNAFRLNKEKKLSEKYFREYLQVLKNFALTQRLPEDVKTAENLGDISREDGNYAEAVDAYKGAILTYKALTQDEQAKYPVNRIQFSLAEVLLRKGATEEAIPQARELLNDKEYNLKGKRLLAEAYLQLDQAEKALDYLNELKNTDVWGPQTMRFTAQALLAKQPQEALKYIEQAEQAAPKQVDDELTLLHAKVLAFLDRFKEAGELFNKVLQVKPNSFKAQVGLGDLEMKLANASQGQSRLAHLKEAVKFYKQARDQHRSDPEILNMLAQAEQEHARTDAELQIHNDRVKVVLYTGGLILAALIPIGFMIYIYRRQWALHCFREVCDLERDLIVTIRDKVRTRWLGNWDRFGEEAFRGRLDYKSLRSRAERDGARDILGVANFGHLVGIVDAGWEVLGLGALCDKELADPKEVIIANLSYVSSCRTCLAHFGKLDELTAGPLTGGNLKSHLSKHLHRQVKTSLRVIRARFHLGAQPQGENDLPVLTAIKKGPGAGS